MAESPPESHPVSTTGHDPAIAAAGVPAAPAIGVLGGMIGLGGAEFRLPLLIGVFGFVALQAVILNKAMSLIVVLLPCRRGCRGALQRPRAALASWSTCSPAAWSAPGSARPGRPGCGP